MYYTIKPHLFPVDQIRVHLHPFASVGPTSAMWHNLTISQILQVVHLEITIWQETMRIMLHLHTLSLLLICFFSNVLLP